MKKSSMNIPNILSIIRCLLVPIFVASLLFMRLEGIWAYVIPAAIYGLTALTDMLDGKIARKYNLVTDFGKFIDPLADKFMVISSMVAILAWMLCQMRLRLRPANFRYLQIAEYTNALHPLATQQQA